ncbi:MAG: hypothetical protein WCH39_28305, partial [Schlesneria sp.]
HFPNQCLEKRWSVIAEHTCLSAVPAVAFRLVVAEVLDLGPRSRIAATIRRPAQWFSNSWNLYGVKLFAEYPPNC